MTTYLVPLTDFTPPERDDGHAWVTALIYEAATPDMAGAALLRTVTLSPVDPDPANPATRSFTLDNATVPNGWYQVIWQDAALNQAAAPPLQYLPIVRAWRPLVSDIGAILRGRTTDSNGVDVGTFTALTQPTYEQVDRVIDAAMRDLESTFGPNMNAELVGTAQKVVALYAAAEVEGSFFGEQVIAGRSLYDRLYARYQEALARWVLARKQLGADGTPDTDDDQSAAGLPAYVFPPIGGPLDFGSCADRVW